MGAILRIRNNNQSCYFLLKVGIVPAYGHQSSLLVGYSGEGAMEELQEAKKTPSHLVKQLLEWLVILRREELES